MFTLAILLAPRLTLQTPTLESPFLIKKSELEAGNPLAVYVEMLRLEKAYTADAAWRDQYWQARGTVAANLGDTQESDEDWDRVFPPDWPREVVKKSPLEAYRPVDAVEAIARAAKSHRWVMVGEEHLRSQSRSILPALLRTLRKQGFRTLAVETLRSGAPLEEVQKTGVVTYRTGDYTADPTFAAGIREAIRLGYRLVPYEAEDAPPPPRPGDPYFRLNFRETRQAENLKKRIFDLDPKAKVLVWAGRAHVLKAADPVEPGETNSFHPMGSEFRRLTGEDPLSVHGQTYAEHSLRRFENPLYRWVTDRGLVRRPTVFVDPSGKAYGDAFDMQIFWPRTTWVQGRPDWMRRELGRSPVPIPSRLIDSSGLQLVQAFAPGDPANAVPHDQILIRPGESVPALMLPKGPYRLRVIRADGKETSDSLD